MAATHQIISSIQKSGTFRCNFRLGYLGHVENVPSFSLIFSFPMLLHFGSSLVGQDTESQWVQFAKLQRFGVLCLEGKKFMM